MIRIVFKSKEPYATVIASRLMYSPLQENNKQDEKPERVTRSIQKRQEKNTGESFKEREKGDIQPSQRSTWSGKGNGFKDYRNQSARLGDQSPENRHLDLFTFLYWLLEMRRAKIPP